MVKVSDDVSQKIETVNPPFTVENKEFGGLRFQFDK